MVTAHSGALAGEDGAYEAVFETYGVHQHGHARRVADAMELFAWPRRVPSGGAIASIHDSGGERVLFVDVASDLGVPFAQISDATTARSRTRSTRGSRRRTRGRVGDRHRCRSIFLESFRACTTIPTWPRWRSWWT